jgi:hypothetical protein
MPEQGEALPAQRIGDIEHRVHRTDEGIVAAGRQVRAAAVAGLVDRDQVDAMQVRRQRNEARRVVQPAVQGQHLRRAGFAAAQGADATERDLDLDVAHHDQPSSPCTSAANASACASPALRHGM